jgi:peptidoglycan hydrolase-like protein with peptidoglycan-binding domain
VGRRNILAIVAAVAVLSAGVGWVLGQRIKSPAELAAETAPPEPSLITVPVELRELSSRVVVRGTVESSGSTVISVSGSTEGIGLITRLPLQSGDPLEEGDVVIEVAGRPVFVLQGELPEFRNLAPGMDGPDIEQLEVALNRLGYDVGDLDDVYTVSTGLAVAELYEDLGYRADAPTREELAVLDSAEDRVDQILDQLNAASGSGSSSGLPRSQLLQLDQAITQATDAVADAKEAKENGLADLAAARNEAVTAKAQAHQALIDAEARLRQAQDGAHPDTGQPPTEDELDALTQAVTEAKRVAAEAAAAASDAAVAYDQAAVAFDRAIRDANVQLEIARASKSEAIAAAAQGDGGSGVNVADLREDLAEAREDLAALQATIGVRLPAAEFRFVKTLPSVVQSVDVELGQVPVGPAMTIAGASTVLESSVSESDRRLLELGMEGVAEDDDIGVSVPVRITELADQPRSSDSGGVGRYPMELVPLGPLPEEAMFQSLRVTIPVSSTGGEVLAVPLAAVSAGADGSSRVEVDIGDGSTTLVEVSTGLSAEGFVEIRPVEGELRPGDRVVVGRDLLLPADGPDSESESEDGEAFGSGARW